MIPTLKAEFRKLFTIRSTYIITLVVLLFTGLMSFYFEGYKGNTGSAASTLEPTALQEIIGNTAGMGVLFLAIIAVLFMAHEYRYNTIMYTLTANTRRTTVLLIKMLTISIFSVMFSLVTVLFGVGMYLLGVQLRDAALPAQEFSIWTSLGKVMLYYIGYALIGVMLAVLLRVVVGAVAALLLVPTTVEPLIGIVLKDNAVYLPFAALDTIMGASLMQGNLTSTAAIGVSAIYIAVFGVITWLLFLRRDAN